MRKILQRMWKYMIETIAAVNQAVNSFIWGIPAMVCIIGAVSYTHLTLPTT